MRKENSGGFQLKLGETDNGSSTTINGTKISNLTPDQIKAETTTYIDFEKEFSNLIAISKELASGEHQTIPVTKGTYDNQDNFHENSNYELDLKDAVPDATNNNRIVLNLNAADFGDQAGEFIIKNIPKDAIVVINVKSDKDEVNIMKKIVLQYEDVTKRENKETENFSDSTLLWNFATIKKITLNSPFQGSILAPEAELNGGNQNIDGSIIVHKFYGAGETHRWDFQGTKDGGFVSHEFDKTPEPSVENPDSEVQPENPGETQPENPDSETQPESPGIETQPENPGSETQPENPGSENPTENPEDTTEENEEPKDPSGSTDETDEEPSVDTPKENGETPTTDVPKDEEETSSEESKEENPSVEVPKEQEEIPTQENPTTTNENPNSEEEISTEVKPTPENPNTTEEIPKVEETDPVESTEEKTPNHSTNEVTDNTPDDPSNEVTPDTSFEVPTANIPEVEEPPVDTIVENDPLHISKEQEDPTVTPEETTSEKEDVTPSTPLKTSTQSSTPTVFTKVSAQTVETSTAPENDEGTSTAANGVGLPQTGDHTSTTAGMGLGALLAGAAALFLGRRKNK